MHVGVLTLYRDTPGDLDASNLRDAIAFTHIATHLLLELGTNLTPGRLPDRLAEIVEGRAQVHQATRIIAAQLDTDVATPLSRLQAFAWSQDRSIDDTVTDVIAHTVRFDGQAP